MLQVGAEKLGLTCSCMPCQGGINVVHSVAAHALGAWHPAPVVCACSVRGWRSEVLPASILEHWFEGLGASEGAIACNPGWHMSCAAALMSGVLLSTSCRCAHAKARNNEKAKCNALIVAAVGWSFSTLKPSCGGTASQTSHASHARSNGILPR